MLEEMVDYDLDADDTRWLAEFNMGRTNPLHEDIFELIIDRFEKDAFVHEGSLENSALMRQLAIDGSDDVCAVCQDGQSEDANQIVYCDGCEMAVHQQCYGLFYIPEGSWKCHRCQDPDKQNVRCVLCHDEKLGGLKRTVTGEWVHVSCAIWMPGTKITYTHGPAEIEYLGTIDISGIPRERYEMLCAICKRKGGACISCVSPGCKAAFHVSCARSAGLKMRCTMPESSHADADATAIAETPHGRRNVTVPPAPWSTATYRAYCEAHRPWGPRRKSATPALTPAPDGETPTRPQRAPRTPACEASSEGEQAYKCLCGAVFERSQDKAAHCHHCAAFRRGGPSAPEAPQQPQTPGRAAQGAQQAPPTPSVALRSQEQAAAQAYQGVKLRKMLGKIPGVPSQFIEGVFPYWVAKRTARNHLPLLKRFDPSIVIRHHSALEKKKKKNRVVDDNEALAKMQTMRFDIERVRNLLEVVLRRERTKLEIVNAWTSIVDDISRTPLQKKLFSVLNALRELDRHKFFHEPVSAEEVPTYPSVIKTPMDFETMAHKIEANAYTTWQGFARDFELVCTNAMTFNDSKSPYHREARVLLRQGCAVISAAVGDKYEPAAVRAPAPPALLADLADVIAPIVSGSPVVPTLSLGTAPAVIEPHRPGGHAQQQQQHHAGGSQGQQQQQARAAGAGSGGPQAGVARSRVPPRPASGRSRFYYDLVQRIEKCTGGCLANLGRGRRPVDLEAVGTMYKAVAAGSIGSLAEFERVFEEACDHADSRCRENTKGHHRAVCLRNSGYRLIREAAREETSSAEPRGRGGAEEDEGEDTEDEVRFEETSDESDAAEHRAEAAAAPPAGEDAGPGLGPGESLQAAAAAAAASAVAQMDESEHDRMLEDALQMHAMGMDELRMEDADDLFGRHDVVPTGLSAASDIEMSPAVGGGSDDEPACGDTPPLEEKPSLGAASSPAAPDFAISSSDDDGGDAGDEGNAGDEDEEQQRYGLRPRGQQRGVEAVDEAEAAGGRGSGRRSSGSGSGRGRGRGRRASSSRGRGRGRGHGHITIDGSPSTVVLFAQNTVSLAVDDNGRSVAAAATYDSGKVCLFSHGNYISKEKSDFGLVSNCIAWMKTGRSSLVCSLNGLDTPTQRDAVTAAGCTSTTSGGLTQSALAGVDVLFLNSEDLDDNGAHTSQNIEAVRAFVRNGGSLVVSGLGWYWTTYRNPVLATHPANLLLAPCGLAVTNDYARLSSGAIVQKDSDFSEGMTNLWYAFEAFKSSGSSVSSTTMAFVDSQLASLRKCIASGLDGDHMASLRQEAASAFYAACSSLRWGVTSQANRVSKTDQQRRGCMDLAWSLPASVYTVDWAAESALFPGNVPSAPQVTRTVTVPRERTRWYSTALFVSAASDLTVRIPASEIGNLALQVGCHTDVLPDRDDWSRWREIAVSVPLNAEETTVKVKFAGLLYINVAAMGSPVDVQISGKLSDAPVYRAGITTAEQWNAAVSSTASPWGEFEVQDVIFSLPTASLRKVQDMASVGDYWQRVMDCVYHFRTIAPEDWKQRYVTDVQISAGYMHNGYPIMMWLEVADETLMTTPHWNHWGQFHEVGHNMQSPMWTFDGTGEVTNNMWSLYCERKMTGKWEWQEDNLKSALVMSGEYQKHPDFNVWKDEEHHYMALLFYVAIGERWGWDTFMDLFREYDALPQNQRPVSDDDKRDQWLIRTSKRVNHNLTPLFDLWGIPISHYARRQVAGLPAYSTPDSALVQGHVSLRSFFNMFASAQDDGSVQVDRTTVQAWEAFDIIPSADKPGAVVACNIDKAADWETFFPMPRGGNRWRFRATNGLFLQTLYNPRVLAAYNSEPQGWETFTVDFLPSELLGRVSLKSYFNTYASAQQDGTVQVDRTSVQDWEVFTVEASPSNPSAVVFKSAHGKYLSANPDTHQVTCDRDSASDWETFFPESKGNDQWVFRATNGKYLETIDNPRSLAAYNTVPQGWETFTVQHM
eukprot:m51a1_g8611 hypothetical protein (1980) ;mRNA; f:617-8898